MKDSEILHALEHIDADLIEKAATPQKKKHPRLNWVNAVAALLVLAIGLSLFAPELGPSPGLPTDPTQPPTDPIIRPIGQLCNLLSEPVYPEMAAYPNYDDYPDWQDYEAAYNAWRDSQSRQYDQPEGYANSLREFFHTSIRQFLQEEGNATYSPVNTYLALAMLAETASGNSRQQILDLLAVSSVERLRTRVDLLWNAHYCADGQTSLLLANSLWLDDAYSFKEATAELLADRYYASSFSGDLGTVKMNEQLQYWLNENTGGLLKEQAGNVQLEPDAVFALASTVSFTASWKEKFNESNTYEALFHSPKGDVQVPFMHKTLQTHTYFWGENFSAVSLSLTGNNRMWLILPDEGHTVSEILESKEYLQMTLSPSAWQNRKNINIRLSLPKFDVSDQKDLCDGIKAIGVTDIFDYSISDFTSLTDTPELFVSKIDHAVRVAIDEKGCVGAAYTVIMTEPGTAPTDQKIDFTLDRPFLFIVSSQDDLPLFAGIVNDP
ncbi:MAG: hypothetical protein IJD63_02235 [Oscillospiraceae bacterium]|nr:hypothetical protein [Oscillospiraceae bacterium]